MQAASDGLIKQKSEEPQNTAEFESAATEVYNLIKLVADVETRFPTLFKIVIDDEPNNDLQAKYA